MSLTDVMRTQREQDECVRGRGCLQYREVHRSAGISNRQAGRVDSILGRLSVLGQSLSKESNTDQESCIQGYQWIKQSSGYDVLVVAIGCRMLSLAWKALRLGDLTENSGMSSASDELGRSLKSYIVFVCSLLLARQPPQSLFMFTFK